jgi:hypothetical protein
MIDETKKSLKFISSIIVSSIIVLSACAKPTMQAPQVSQGELQQEQQVQAQYAAEDKLRRQENREQERLKMQERLTRVFTPIARAGAKVCTQVNAGEPDEADCVFEARILEPKDKENNPDDVRGINAFADGEKIMVTQAMMRFAKDDQELAFVLSHELSHNILHHMDSQRMNALGGMLLGALLDGLASSRGYNTQGAFSDAGGKMGAQAYSPAFEAEADYVGMYIMANAGEDYRAAANFWRRMSTRNPDAIYLTTTHPTNPSRYVAMQKTAQEIDMKKRSGLALLPTLQHDMAQNQ